MASRALTALSPRKRSVTRPEAKTPEPRRDWLQTISSQDASAIWRRIFSLVQSSGTHLGEPSKTTQDLFLSLVATGRLETYTSGRWRDDEIEADIRSLLQA